MWYMRIQLKNGKDVEFEHELLGHVIDSLTLFCLHSGAQYKGHFILKKSS